MAGETLADPSGWRGLGLVALWLMPLLVLSVLAYARPAAAVPILAVASLVPVGLGVWALVDFVS